MGYYYGSDGYIWGREFLSRKPKKPREIEIVKHWYHWMLWGRLGYNPDLSNDRLVDAFVRRTVGFSFRRGCAMVRWNRLVACVGTGT